ncbi:MAG TPA: hypothetical protein VEX68_01770 [Bryobacteraceae bacterium]|nr:hypothetical protein [Bryobacteraceae bacterium]
MKFTATAFVKAAIENDPGFAYWALSVIYRGQTPDEREVRKTRWSNCRGFSAGDARRLSVIAEDIPILDSPPWRTKVAKYASQIVDVIMRGQQ